MEFAQKKDYAVCVEFQDTMITGFVKEYDEEIICMNILTDFGEYNGVCKFHISELKVISVDTDDEQDILLLSDHINTIDRM